jgi:hypothetical protein
MRLLYVATGLILLAATAATFAVRRIRRLEADLRDYDPRQAG